MGYKTLDCHITLLRAHKLIGGVGWVGPQPTPIAWTAYILIADAAVLAITGHSRLHDGPKHFAHTALHDVIEHCEDHA